MNSILNKMTKNSFKNVKNELEKQKAIIEKELEKFAQKDKNKQDDWDTRFPKFNSDSNVQALEDEASEVEEYITLLPQERNLEARLRDINLSLEKLKKGKYGKCEKCGQPISKQRLKIYPEARFCLKCAPK